MSRKFFDPDPDRNPDVTPFLDNVKAKAKSMLRSGWMDCLRRSTKEDERDGEKDPNTRMTKLLQIGGANDACLPPSIETKSLS